MTWSSTWTRLPLPHRLPLLPLPQSQHPWSLIPLNDRSPTRRTLPHYLFPSPLPNALLPSLPLIPPPFFLRGHPHYLLSPRHTTPLAPSRLTPITVPSPRLCSLLPMAPVRRAASQVAHTVVCPPHSCIVRARSHLPTRHPTHASHHRWLRRVRRRRHTTHSLRRPPPPLPLPTHLHRHPPRVPAPPSPVRPRHSSFPSRSVAQRQIATSHTSRRTVSNTT
jgi:hypothetical protein